MAGAARFGKRCIVEALHLTDGTVEVVTLTSQKLKTRSAKSDGMLASMAAGWFPARPDPVTCPRCPHFFVCPAAPGGPLDLA